MKSVVLALLFISIFVTACASVRPVEVNTLPQKGIVQCVIGGQVLGCTFTSLSSSGSSLDVSCEDGGRILLPVASCIVIAARPPEPGTASSVDVKDGKPVARR